MNSDTPNILSDFRKLILESCAFQDIPSMHFQHFHHDFLKFFFGVMDVKMEYEKKTILIWSSKPLTTNPIKLFNINTSVTEIVSYVDLDDTLLGCVEEGQFQLRFYNQLIHEYSLVDSFKKKMRTITE